MGPVWNGGKRNEDEKLASCYRRCMQLAGEHGCLSLAFPAISSGIYRFPVHRAATIAIRTVCNELLASGIQRIFFCCFNQQTEHTYRDLLDATRI